MGSPASHEFTVGRFGFISSSLNCVGEGWWGRGRFGIGGRRKGEGGNGERGERGQRGREAGTPSGGGPVERVEGD
jgi:hypothetical protein